MPARKTAMTQTRLWSVHREVSVFVFLTALGCLALTSIAVTEDVDVAQLDGASTLGATALFANAFVPGLAAVLTRLLSSGGVSGLGWGAGTTSRRTLLACWLAPIGAFAVAYGLVWTTGAGGFSPEKLAEEGMPAPVAALVGLTLGVIPFTLLALGEEIGWRGLMVQRLSETMTFPRVALWTGLVWTAFHLPLMLFVDGAVEGVPLAYAIAMFGIGTVALSLPLTWLRLRTGSVWAASVLHAAYNAALYFVADPLTTDTGDTAWFAGESGVVLALVTVATVAIWWHRTGERGRRPIAPQLRPLQEAS